jgi:hypothetical protein
LSSSDIRHYVVESGAIPHDRDRCLAEADPAVVGRNRMMNEGAKALLLEHFDRPIQQEHVLKHAAAECDHVVTGARANNPASLHNHLSQRVVEAGGDNCVWHLLAKVLDNGANQVATAEDQYFLLIDIDFIKGRFGRVSMLLELDCRLTFVVDRITDAKNRPDRIE